MLEAIFLVKFSTARARMSRIQPRKQTNPPCCFHWVPISFRVLRERIGIVLRSLGPTSPILGNTWPSATRVFSRTSAILKIVRREGCGNEASAKNLCEPALVNRLSNVGTLVRTHVRTAIKPRKFNSLSYHFFLKYGAPLARALGPRGSFAFRRNISAWTRQTRNKPKIFSETCLLSGQVDHQIPNTLQLNQNSHSQPESCRRYIIFPTEYKHPGLMLFVSLVWAQEAQAWYSYKEMYGEFWNVDFQWKCLIK